ncbi:helix-turn-helix transcriptional regulator [Candidatus Woesearchaeota archaeon]|nr:helix-turn-helix transcriptional regulator [Candidatus Woesearchaeota archaeon]
MVKDPFLLVSLEESESKALAQVMSNDTARKILDFLSKEESATETSISKRLKVPLSTVHYNLQALVKANLVAAEEFHYSEKGKEVLHYRLANKLIIIAPKRTSAESFREKLRGLLPVGIISVAIGGLLQLYASFSSRLLGWSAGSMEQASLMMYDSGVASQAASGAGSAAEALAEEAVPMAMKAAPEVARTAADASLGAPAAAPHALDLTANSASQAATHAFAWTGVWFVLGALFALLVLALWYYFSSRKKKA